MVYDAVGHTLSHEKHSGLRSSDISEASGHSLLKEACHINNNTSWFVCENGNDTEVQEEISSEMKIGEEEMSLCVALCSHDSVYIAVDSRSSTVLFDQFKKAFKRCIKMTQ